MACAYHKLLVATCLLMIGVSTRAWAQPMQVPTECSKPQRYVPAWPNMPAPKQSAPGPDFNPLAADISGVKLRMTPQEVKSIAARSGRLLSDKAERSERPELSYDLGQYQLIVGFTKTSPVTYRGAILSDTIVLKLSPGMHIDDKALMESAVQKFGDCAAWGTGPGSFLWCPRDNCNSNSPNLEVDLKFKTIILSDPTLSRDFRAYEYANKAVTQRPPL